MSPKPISNLTLDATCTTEIVDQYVGMAQDIAARLGLSTSDVHISENALILALKEAKTDLEIMAHRRRPSKGISAAKIAGILTFRLSRFAPINLSGRALEDGDALKINELTAMALAMKAVLLLDIKDVSSGNATKELQYTLARRHMNQETLGLAYELITG